MCGISGIATKRLARVDLEGSIGRMARSIRHRGPDGLDSRCFVPPAISQSVALAHNRLAIIDISPAGGEPMANEDGTIWLVFNGEIYNFVELRARLESRGHRFHSRTDAEVIIHLYEEAGPPCVKQLDGIFAFAILDLKRDLLFLARDPVGVKPLFYAITPHHFLFGSEIKALLASSFITPAPDWQAISDFFTYLYVPGPETAFTGVQQLLPAHTLTLHLQDNSIALNHYWDVSRREDLESMSYEELKSAIQKTLSAGVKRQLVSDVPLGVFLSGGIDSTIVAGLAKREKKDTQTYTLGLPGQEYRFFDERETARAVSRHLHTEHRELSLEFPDLLEMLDLIEFFDQPFANPTSYLMHQLSQKAREHITVALCGAGGDELFAGYPRASAVRMARRLAWMPRPLLRLGANALSLMRDSHQTPYLRRARKFLGGLDPDFFVQYANWTYFMNENQKRQPASADILTVATHIHRSMFCARPTPNPSCATKIIGSLQMDFKTFLVDNILDYTDRMSMASALEVRVPLLDPCVRRIKPECPVRLQDSERWIEGHPGRFIRRILPARSAQCPQTRLQCPSRIVGREPVRSLL